MKISLLSKPEVPAKPPVLVLVLLLVALVLTALTPKADAQVLDHDPLDVVSLTLTNTSSSNIVTTPFMLSGQNTNLAFFTTVKGAHAGTSNVVFSIKWGITSTVFADALVLVTNACNGSNVTVSTLNILAPPWGARYAKVTTLQTAQTNNVTVTAKFGQFKPRQ